MSHLRKYGFLYSILIVLIAVGITYSLHPEYFDFLLQPSRRTVYERLLKEDADKLQKWTDLLQLAQNDQVQPQDSYIETLLTDTEHPFSAGYLIDIAQGENLIVETPHTHQKIQWIIEIRHLNGNLIQDAKVVNGILKTKYVPNSKARIQVIVQATIEHQGKTELKIYKQPVFGFPVAEKSNDAIQSFWGAPRGGGSRSHEGNDIFAAKNTPVIAISSGRVSSIRNRGLGGKQVWIKDSDTGLSQYYAHLNGWNVSSGDRVKKGDTIGYVGNTGNAATTPPHLHFGIYQNGRAIDPKPFIWNIQLPDQNIELQQLKNPVANGFAANLRIAPDGNSEIIKDLKTEPIQILGTSNNWYHVRTLDGKAGYAHKSVITEN